MADRSQWTVMTVEHRETAEIPSRNNQIILNQLREITGNSDVIALQQALQAAQGDVSQAVALLTETPNQNAGCALSSSQSHRSLPSQSQSSSVIDLTGDDKDDLQRAIALSLQETSERAVRADLTTEEQDISRVLEESLAEASGPGGVKRKRDSPCACSCPREGDGASGGGAVEGDVAVSAVRAPGAPVGLKNVGNTCWFSAVVQSLFNLPGFRRLILGFTLPDSRLQNPQSENERVGLCFMRELRVLFALMVGSVRGFVDPSPAVHILKGAFRGADTQQDVSEFTHKLLDWLEDAFRISAEESRDDSLKTVNPMVDLFYGRARSIGTNQGKRFAVLEGFGPLPVRVSGFHDLHECLEHATMAGDIEQQQQQQQPPACASSGQELWFSELPPVLTLELSRFRFNTEVGRPEKIHSRLEFPDTIYMDRYMESNKEVTRIKRDEIRRLSEQQSHLQQTLARYQSYGSGPQRYPLVDILSCALQFASTPPATVLLPPTSLANHKGPSSAAKPPCTLSTNHVTTSPTVSSSHVVSTNNIALFPIAESTTISSTNHVVSSPTASPLPVLSTNHSDPSSTVPPTPMQSTNRIVSSPTSLPIPVPLTNHVAPSCATTPTPLINHTAPSPAVLPIHIASTNHVAPPSVVKSPAERALLVDDTGPVLINGIAELGVALPSPDESSKQPKAEALDINGDLSESESTAAPGCVVAGDEVHQQRQQPQAQPPSAAATVACAAPEPHHTQERHGARSRQEVPAQQKSSEQNRTGDPPPPGTEQRTADSQQASVPQQGSLQQEAMQVDTLQENVQQGEEEGSQQKDVTQQQQQELAQGESNRQTETQQRFDLQPEANQVSLLQDAQQQQHRGNVQQEHVQQGNPQQGNFQQENSEQCKEQQEGSTQQCDVQRVQAVEARQEGGRLEWHGCPAPQAVTALELETMRAVLSRWNSQVQRELQDLQDSICRIKRTIDLMYTDKTFRQLPYRLHAVLVHDGQAMAGHYWAYVREHARSPAASTSSSSSSTTNGNSASSNSNSVGASEESLGSSSCWRKFNDVRVSRASWAELVRDSYGGGARSASAYCLVYVNARAHEFTTELAGEAVGDLSSLSPALRDLVAKDNHRFLSEMAARGNGPERPAEPDGGDTREPGQRAEPREHEQEERRHEQAPARAGPPAAPPPREGEGSGAACEQERADKHSQTNSLEQEAEPTREHERANGRARAGEREETRVGEREGRATDVASISETQRHGSEADGSASLPGREVTPAPSPSPSGTEEYMKVGPDTPTEKPRVERVVEVSIPDVGTIVVQAEEHGYNDEVMLTPAMQGVLMAVARARLVREAQGPEATLIEAFRVEYARLRALAQESYPDASSPASPPLAPAGTSGAAWRGREERLEHVVIYLFQNEAPNRVVERALLEQFADRNLSYDEQLIKIMKVAQAKLQEISPEDMDPAEYQKWHQEYELFRQVCVYLVMGIEKYQEGRYTEALPCLMHAHAVNEELLARGQRRGVRRDVLARYRRVCVRRVNEACALTFGAGDVGQATRSLAVMTELVLPAMALLAPLGSSCEGGDAGDEAAVARESDLCAVELMRDRWCSYLGRDDMASELQELLTDFLPRLLDYQPEPAPPTQLTPPPLQGPPPPPPPPSEPRKCESSGENWRGLRAPPRLKAYSPHTLAEKMAEVLRVNRPREA